MKILLILVVAGLASLSSFVVHVATVEWLPAWIASQMQGLLVIRRAFAKNELIEHTKTKQVRRYRITEYAAEILKGIPVNLSPFAFAREDGKPYTNKNLNAIWSAACKNAGISIKLQNAFRHSLGCQLLDMGESIDMVQDALGHTTPGMSRRYAERSNDVVSDALERRRVVQLPSRKSNLVE